MWQARDCTGKQWVEKRLGRPVGGSKDGLIFLIHCSKSMFLKERKDEGPGWKAIKTCGCRADLKNLPFNNVFRLDEFGRILVMR